MTEEERQALLDNLAKNKSARLEHDKEPEAASAPVEEEPDSPPQTLIGKLTKALGPLSTPDG